MTRQILLSAVVAGLMLTAASCGDDADSSEPIATTARILRGWSNWDKPSSERRRA